MRSRKKYQVFVSSTFDDLYQERQAVTWALLKARFVPVGMEAFSATDDRGWRTITATIDDSDYYILILAGKLGSVDAFTGKSWTRREYEYARAKGVPVLAFIRDQAAVTQDKAERDPSRVAMLEDFVHLVESNHHREGWTDQADLVSRVSTALNNHVQDDEHDGRERPGWYRGDQLPASAEALDEMARLSKENADLRTELASHRAERPRLEVWSHGKQVSDELFLQQPRVKLPESIAKTDSYDIFSASRLEADPYKVADAINTTIWFKFALHNSSSVPARSVRVQISIAPAEDIVIRPASMIMIPITDRRANPTAHVYIDQYSADGGVGRIIQRIKSVNPGGDEPLVKFGVRLPRDVQHHQLKCHVSATDEGGLVLDVKFSVIVLQPDPIDIAKSELANYDAKPANLVTSAT